MFFVNQKRLNQHPRVHSQGDDCLGQRRCAICIIMVIHRYIPRFTVHTPDVVKVPNPSLSRVTPTAPRKPRNARSGRSNSAAAASHGQVETAQTTPPSLPALCRAATQPRFTGRSARNRRRVGLIRQKDSQPLNPDRRFGSRPGDQLQPAQIVRVDRQFHHPARCCHDVLPAR